MIFSYLKSGIRVSDDNFDAIYTDRIKEISKFHFTPVEIAIAAAQYLVNKSGAKVLDVGSGAGKFCMVGAACTDGIFTGVEHRKSLFQLSNSLAKSHQLTNTRFLHSNITEIDFCEFDAIYFFNAFYENILSEDPIDSSIKLERDLHAQYSEYMRAQLAKMPVGTRLATYFSFSEEIPSDLFKVQSVNFDQKLKFWEKKF